jgi:hypothetical protein
MLDPEIHLVIRNAHRAVADSPRRWLEVAEGGNPGGRVTSVHSVRLFGPLVAMQMPQSFPQSALPA